MPDWFTAGIETFSDGSFQLSHTGREAVLVPVESDDGSEIDTVAFFIGRPRKLWRERLFASHLGDRVLHVARWYQRPVRLVATPAYWLRDPETVCVLDWWSCDLRTLFGDVPGVICASDVMKGFLLRRLAEQVAPRFKIEVAK